MFPTRRTPTTLAVTAAALALLSGCSSEPQSTETTSGDTRLELTQEVASGSLILVDPHNAILNVGQGLIYRARITDANGQAIASARPTWRTSNPSVASANPLPDSVGTDGTRVAVGAHAVGSALLIASYNGLADTSRLTVNAVVDTIPTQPPPPPPPPYTRPLTFNATITVRGFVAGADSGSAGTLPLPGATVTLTRLPSVAGDSLPPGVTSVGAPTVVGTVTADANGRVAFQAVPQSRFRIDVTPPAGSSWLAGGFTSPPPQVAVYGRTVTLQRP